MSAEAGAAGALARAIAAADRLAGWTAAAGVSVLCAGMLVVIADIAARRALGVSILGTLDLTQLAVMSCVFLAMPLAFLRGAHVGVEFLTDRLAPRALAALECAVGLLCAVFVGALAYHGALQARIAWMHGDRSATLGIPMVLYWAPLVAGLAASALCALLGALAAAARARRA
ncbi:MAG: TRAP transporter small permease subunit [Burkholderiales bacterium]|nr:TRAP transporter small permease subunit [Burkholderiales bacterium]